MPSDLLQRAPEEAVARIARGWLASARTAAARLDDPADEEALHDFRVAVRRLRSTLRAWRDELGRSASRKQRRALREIQQGTGGGRDAEVALAWLRGEREALGPTEQAGLDAMVARLESAHREAMAHAREGVRARFDAIDARLAPRLARVRIELDLDRPGEAPRFGSALAERVREAATALGDGLDAVRGFEHREEGHAARIAGKRLRYLIEPVRESGEACVELCKELQDRLGDLNDAHVLGEEIRRYEADAPEPERAGLRALGQHLDAHARALYAGFEEAWLGARATQRARLGEEVEAFARRCEGAARPSVEIERKYLLERLPDLDALRARGVEVRTLEIDQGWLPGERLRERIRCTRLPDGEKRYQLTVKLGAGVQRIEVEEETSATVFETLWPLTEGCRIRKRRHRIREGGLLWEIDEFLDRDLALAEVELDAPEIHPALPAWLDVVREVTEEGGFTNLSLAR